MNEYVIRIDQTLVDMCVKETQLNVLSLDPVQSHSVNDGIFYNPVFK